LAAKTAKVTLLHILVVSGPKAASAAVHNGLIDPDADHHHEVETALWTVSQHYIGGLIEWRLVNKHAMLEVSACRLEVSLGHERVIGRARYRQLAPAEEDDLARWSCRLSHHRLALWTEIHRMGRVWVYTTA
jgi:hypothetical protein